MTTPEKLTAAREALRNEANARSILVGALEAALYWERAVNAATMTELTDVLDKAETGTAAMVTFDLMAVQVRSRHTWEGYNAARNRLRQRESEREDAFGALGTLHQP